MILCQDKKRALTALVGTMHTDCFPNHRYRLRAIKSYRPSRHRTGSSAPNFAHCQYQGKWGTNCNAALDFSYTFPALINTKEPNCSVGKPCWCSSACPALLCSGAKSSCPVLSCRIRKLMAPLQKLQTPSNNTMGRAAEFIKAWLMPVNKMPEQRSGILKRMY